MKVFRELELYGPHSSLIRAIEIIEGSLDKGWSRRLDQEEQISSLDPEPMYCFSCDSTEEREAASLWLAFSDENKLYVSNIVPDETTELNFDQYNLILKEFYERFAKPAAEALGIEHLLTSDTKQIGDWISEETAKKLKLFSRAANKSTGSSHPLDQQRWFDFLVSAHQEDTALDANTLKRWLIESEGWFEEGAYKLAVEYEFARSLLKFYDEH